MKAPLATAAASYGKYPSLSTLASKYGAKSSVRNAVAGVFKPYGNTATADVTRLRRRGAPRSVSSTRFHPHRVTTAPARTDSITRHVGRRLTRAASRRRRGRRVRGRRVRPPAGDPRRRARHAARSQQLPPVPTAAVPGRDVPARFERHRVLAAQALQRRRQRRRQARAGRVASTRRRARSRPRTGDASRATRWSWRPGRSRTSSAPRAPTSTRSRSTASTTRSGCARASSACSRTPTATRR